MKGFFHEIVIILVAGYAGKLASEHAFMSWYNLGALALYAFAFMLLDFHRGKYSGQRKPWSY